MPWVVTLLLSMGKLGIIRTELQGGTLPGSAASEVKVSTSVVMLAKPSSSTSKTNSLRSEALRSGGTVLGLCRVNGK